MRGRAARTRTRTHTRTKLSGIILHSMPYRQFFQPMPATHLLLGLCVIRNFSTHCACETRSLRSRAPQGSAAAPLGFFSHSMHYARKAPTYGVVWLHNHLCRPPALICKPLALAAATAASVYQEQGKSREKDAHQQTADDGQFRLKTHMKVRQDRIGNRL